MNNCISMAEEFDGDNLAMFIPIRAMCIHLSRGHEKEKSNCG